MSWNYNLKEMKEVLAGTWINSLGKKNIEQSSQEIFLDQETLWEP